MGLAVSLRKGGDIIELGEHLRTYMAKAQAGLPVGVAIDEVISQPDAVTKAIQTFVRALAEAVAVVLLVTFISLGLRTGLVVALSIPLVLGVTFFGMRLFDVGLHKISLGALILALGLLVDDADEWMSATYFQELRSHPCNPIPKTACTVVEIDQP